MECAKEGPAPERMRYAFRQLQKNPKFVVLAVLTLALGIGINTTTFSLVYALLYRMPPFRQPARLVTVVPTQGRENGEDQSPANIHDELAQATSFGSSAAFTYAMSNLARTGEPADRVNGLQVGGQFFTLLGMQPLLGRTLLPADDEHGKNNVIVVSERFWREKLGGRPDAVGTVLRLDAKPVTVVGVMPEAVQDPMFFGPVELWQPLGYDSWDNRINSWLRVIARLKPGVTLEASRAELAAIGARLAHDFPDVNAGRGLTVKTYPQHRKESMGAAPWAIMGLMLAVLLIACVNLANLQLARTVERVREFAVRIALGASRPQLIGHVLGESVLVSLIGGGFGLLVAAWGNRILAHQLDLGGDMPGTTLPLSWPILAFTLTTSMGTGILFGLMPALLASRTDVHRALKQGARGSSGGRGRNWTRQILVIGELALALALLAGAGYFVRGTQRIDRETTSWPTDHLVTGQVVPPWSSYTNDDQLRAGMDRMETELKAIPGVDHEALSISVPIYGLSGLTGFEIEGQPPPPKGQAPQLFAERITPDFFATFGIPLLAGRGFTAADRGDSRRVIIISRSMADRFWPKGDALGHRIGTLVDPKKPDWREIVGIVGDVRFRQNRPTEIRYQTYHPLAQDTDHYLTFTIHGRGSTNALFEAARRAITRADPDIAIFDLSTVDQIIDRGQSSIVLIERLLAVAAFLGLLLAVVGIYGVVAHLAVQRTQEIGIRLAVGAQSRDILWLILKNGAWLSAIGVGIGLLLALAVTRGLSVALPFLPGRDPALIAGLAVLLVAATLAACWLPARRATRIDPIVALREE
jgi:putative ABC transport system permease protein